MISHVGRDLGVALDQPADGGGEAGREPAGGEQGDTSNGHAPTLSAGSRRASFPRGLYGHAGSRQAGPMPQTDPTEDRPDPTSPFQQAFRPAPDRYERMPYRRCGRSGLRLPAVSLGLWHNFGDDRPIDGQRAILRRAVDLGVTHIDLANNYGPPYGSAETNFGRVLARGPGRPAGRAARLHQGRVRHVARARTANGARASTCWPASTPAWRGWALDYVDIFYSHRFDPDTPLEETMGALDTAVRSGRALYAGISSYSPQRTLEAAQILRSMGTPLLIHQPSYSMLNRWVEDGLLDALEEEGIGCIAFSPLAQGMLTDRYLDGIPAGSRASRDASLDPALLDEARLAQVRALNEVAAGRGQSLAQLALAWVLRDPRVTSVLVGASSVAQLEANVAALQRLELSADELAEIDRHAVDSGINLWAPSSAH